MEEKQIICKACEAKGSKGKLLGVNIDAQGEIKLYCKQCKAEHRILLMKDKYIFLDSAK